MGCSIGCVTYGSEAQKLCITSFLHSIHFLSVTVKACVGHSINQGKKGRKRFCEHFLPPRVIYNNIFVSDQTDWAAQILSNNIVISSDQTEAFNCIPSESCPIKLIGKEDQTFDQMRFLSDH